MTNSMLKVTIDKTRKCYTGKPQTDAEKGALSKNLSERVLMSSKDFVEYAANGGTYILGWFNSKTRSNKTFETCDAVGFDFDDNDKLTDIQNVLNINNLKMFLAYETFSHSAEINKYRVIFKLNKEVDAKIREYIATTIKSLFVNAGLRPDKTIDAARFYYGTDKNVVYTDFDATIDVDNFLANYVIPSELPLDAKKVGREIEKIAKNINYTVNNREVEDTVKMFDHIDYKEIASNCKIFNDFINLVRLDHNNLFAIATNLRYMKGGQTLFFETLDAYNKQTEKHSTQFPPYSSNN